MALTMRPFTSLTALTFFVAACLILAGSGELLASADSVTRTQDRVAGAVLLATGLVAALAPALTVRGIAIVVGAGLVIGRAARLAACRAALQSGSEARISRVPGPGSRRARRVGITAHPLPHELDGAAIQRRSPAA